MVKRLPLDTIQKKTSKIVLIGLAAATMVIMVSIVGATQLQQASAARPQFCYPTVFGFSNCQESMRNCQFFQEQDEQAGVASGPCRAQR